MLHIVLSEPSIGFSLSELETEKSLLQLLEDLVCGTEVAQINTSALRWCENHHRVTIPYRNHELVSRANAHTWSVEDRVIVARPKPGLPYYFKVSAVDPTTQ